MDDEEDKDSESHSNDSDDYSELDSDKYVGVQGEIDKEEDDLSENYNNNEIMKMDKDIEIITIDDDE